MKHLATLIVLALAACALAVAVSAKSAAPLAPTFITQAFNVDRQSVTVAGCETGFVEIAAGHWQSMCMDGSGQCEVKWKQRGASNQFVFSSVCGSGIVTDLEARGATWTLTFTLP